MFTKIKTKINYKIKTEKRDLVIKYSKLIATAQLHQKTFPQFKDYCVGRDLVVCGAGPTLQKYVPIENAIHIAVNRAFLYSKVKFDFIFAQDFEGINMVQKEIEEYRPSECVKLFGTQNGHKLKEIPEELARKCNALRFNTDNFIYGNGYDSKFVLNIESMPLGNMPNVGLSVMQFALYMRPETLYIVGCDMSGGHFSNKNQSEQQIKAEKELLNNTWNNELIRLLSKWDEFKEFAQKHFPSTKIVCVNPVGLKGRFIDLFQE